MTYIPGGSVTQIREYKKCTNMTPTGEKQLAQHNGVIEVAIGNPQGTTYQTD